MASGPACARGWTGRQALEGRRKACKNQRSAIGSSHLHALYEHMRCQCCCLVRRSAPRLVRCAVWNLTVTRIRYRKHDGANAWLRGSDDLWAIGREINSGREQSRVVDNVNDNGITYIFILLHFTRPLMHRTAMTRMPRPQVYTIAHNWHTL
jgi:hypothetical protein